MMSLKLLVFSIYIFSRSIYGFKKSWSYDDVEAWIQLYPECGGSSQSPIDIVFDEALTCDEPLLLDWVTENDTFSIINNGHSLQAIPFYVVPDRYGSSSSGIQVLHHTGDTSFNLSNPFYPTYTSAVNRDYCFDSLHFHWGLTDDDGSEHTLNGQRYPLEAHILHYTCDYYTNAEAQYFYSIDESARDSDDNNVLSVISVLFEIGAPNPLITELLADPVFRGVLQVSTENKNLIDLYYTALNLSDLIPENREIIAYTGSLTTPPCYETVRWQVLRNTMTVSEEQMQHFREILASNGSDPNDTIAPNWRPLQDVGSRVLYQCQEQIDAESVEQETPDINVTDMSTTGDSDQQQTESEVCAGKVDDAWFIVGIVFICLFGVSVLVNTYTAYRLHSLSGDSSTGKTTKGGYHQTNHEEEAEMVHR